MARPSSLTERQKQDILRLSLAGETPYVISQRTGIPESTVRRNVTAVSSTIKRAANQIVTGEEMISALPIPAQIVGTEYTASLRAMRATIGKAAVLGADNSLRFHSMAALALDQASRDPDKIDAEALKIAAGVTKAGNDAAAIALDMLKLDKDKDMDDEPDDHKPPSMIELVGPGG